MRGRKIIQTTATTKHEATLGVVNRASIHAQQPGTYQLVQHASVRPSAAWRSQVCDTRHRRCHMTAPGRSRDLLLLVTTMTRLSPCLPVSNYLVPFHQTSRIFSLISYDSFIYFPLRIFNRKMWFSNSNWMARVIVIVSSPGFIRTESSAVIARL